MNFRPIHRRFFLPLFAVACLLPGSCGNQSAKEVDDPDLYALFADPPSASMPFVRWWWNGDCIEPEELERQLDVLRAAGIGGVEINPIAHPLDSLPQGTDCYEWLSDEWNRRVKATVEMARARGMIVDLIMGSGWPFGGEFLGTNQRIQGVGIRHLTLKGPASVTLEVEDLQKLPGRDFGSYNNPDAPEPELFFLRMIPADAAGISEMTDLSGQVDSLGRITVQVPDGDHTLYVGTYQKAFRTVMFGAPGSSGPVVDHYDAADVEFYMDRLGEALERALNGELGDYIRALFCDSIELSGANITDDFPEEFATRRGYRLEPYLPLVYYHPYEGYTDTLDFSPAFANEIRRIRYDFNQTLAELFLERFTETFHEWANEHGMQSRYQAYGMPWLVGMLDGYRMVDIPESNNWLFSSDPKGHGYWIWNKYCASGAHLSGSPVVSCEAMTNTRGVFRATLGMIKQADDFNFITGINHTVLHGYNYSPPEAGFPGWIRFGAYFSEQNSWWRHFPLWSAYNARLSAVFQHSEPVTDIAILTPQADIWRRFGLLRYPFYMNPWYHHDLWEGFSRQGLTADYINEGVLRRGSAREGKLISEMASYQLVIVSGAVSLQPETAEAVRRLAEQGVPFLFVEGFPSEAAGFHRYREGDRAVQEQMQIVAGLGNVARADPPSGPETVTGWTAEVARRHSLTSPVRIHPLREELYMNKYRSKGRDILFLSHQGTTGALSTTLELSDPERPVWRWDPENGERYRVPVSATGVLPLHLQPLESALLVVEQPGEDSGPDGVTGKTVRPSQTGHRQLGSEWTLDFRPVSGSPFRLVSAELFDFATHRDPAVSSFAGEVLYSTAFPADSENWQFIDLGIQKHVTELYLNGISLGTRWYGRHLYPIPEGRLKEGENVLEIRYTTSLANYAASLKDNPVARRWIRLEEPESMGLTGTVRLMTARETK